MKTDRLATVIAALARLRVVAVHGGDGDDIGALARSIVAAEAGSPDDPFRVVITDGSDKAATCDAAGATTLGRGRGVVWARHAGESLVALVEETLAKDQGCLLVLEIGAATARSRLRTAIERSDRGCVVSCRLGPAASRARVEEILSELGVRPDPAAVTAILEHADMGLGTLAAVARAAALYVGEAGTLDVASARLVALGGPAVRIEEALNAALRRRPCDLDRAIERSFEEGVTGVGQLRRALGHLQRLRAGAVADQADDVAPRLGSRLDRLATALWRAEALSKRGGLSQELVASYALSRLAE